MGDLMTLNYLSLFAGIGGLDLGLDRAGMNCVGQVEIDPYCKRVLAKHWPDVPRHDDVRTAAAWWSGICDCQREDVDLVCGGFPCQPFSLAGFQKGIDDDRWMWPQMVDIIRAVRPRYVLVENVANLVRDRVAFGLVLGGLAELGFDAEWRVLRASDFGAPHPRERVYVVAYPQGVHGIAWDRMGESGIGGASLAARGIPGLAAHQRRREASEWLAREPRVDRLVDGIPAQVDRLRVIGNAVVPQVAEHIGRLIVEHDSLVAA